MITILTSENKQTFLNLLLQCDPQVGDTACQIRALILLDFYHYFVNNPQDKIDLSDKIHQSMSDFI